MIEISAQNCKGADDVSSENYFIKSISICFPFLVKD